jgi:hypothetical protein
MISDEKWGTDIGLEYKMAADSTGQ